jgi:hypothetical protein
MLYTQYRTQGLQIREKWLFNEERDARRCVHVLERESRCGGQRLQFLSSYQKEETSLTDFVSSWERFAKSLLPSTNLGNMVL